MRVTKTQALANRAHIVKTASALFRERGYDGVGVADLMAAAGFTHGGFYKHFRSKADLMAKAAESGFSQVSQFTAETDVNAFVDYYLSRKHRDERGSGCTMAALCGDAARQSDEVKATFVKGIERLLAGLGQSDHVPDGASQQETRAATLDMLAHVVGAIVLSRACPDDSSLADEILDACRARRLVPSSSAKLAE
ncbi:TetR family transcriptional regulator [Pectobacterium araliae]|uniref:TetR family transcriptional regulator n=1 Tax=Pectobacterium araliae TaxID=3073862 RepID=A0AAN0KIK5_9GAMM|nr:TetR family transcriptional regulator [Pectobacterium sp. MAFF 302110]GKW20237.1 TetR family transcriptional regulator [Pectobacterium carotovorum subsp. carotovorum]